MKILETRNVTRFVVEVSTAEEQKIRKQKHEIPDLFFTYKALDIVPSDTMDMWKVEFVVSTEHIETLFGELIY